MSLFIFENFRNATAIFRFFCVASNDLFGRRLDECEIIHLHNSHLHTTTNQQLPSHQHTYKPGMATLKTTYLQHTRALTQKYLALSVNKFAFDQCNDLRVSTPTWWQMDTCVSVCVCVSMQSKCGACFNFYVFGNFSHFNENLFLMLLL